MVRADEFFYLLFTANQETMVRADEFFYLLFTANQETGRVGEFSMFYLQLTRRLW